jgi:hypothetical protein
MSGVDGETIGKPMDDVDGLLLWIRPPAADPTSPDVVEVAVSLDGVLLRVHSKADGPSTPVPISMWGWGDFLAAIAADGDDGEFPIPMPKGVTYRSSEVPDTSPDVVEISRTDGGVLLRVVPVVRFTRTGDGGYSMHVDPKATVHAVGIPWRAWVDFIGEAHSEVYSVTLPPADDVLAVLDGPGDVD